MKPINRSMQKDTFSAWNNGMSNNGFRILLCRGNYENIYVHSYNI